MKRLYIYNPQKTLHISDNLFAIFKGGLLPKTKKYDHLLTLLRNKQAFLLVDFDGSSFLDSSIPLISTVVSLLEAVCWSILNSIPLTSICIPCFFKPSDNDFLFVFSHEHLQKPLVSSSVLLRAKCPIFVHLSHYFFRTYEISMNVRALFKPICISESYLPGCQYYNLYFSGINFRQLTPVLPDRFRSWRFDHHFLSRDKRCLAVGSYQTYSRQSHTKYFIDHYSTDTIHPLRKEIYLNRDFLSAIISCNISSIDSQRCLYNSSRNSVGLHPDRRGFTTFYFKSDHYKDDIRLLYSHHRFCIATDEVGCLVAISTYEAMSCGCVCICIPSQTLANLGLHPHIHYLPFDGTLDSLISLLHNLPSDNDLEQISLVARAHVIKRLNIQSFLASLSFL